MASVTFPTEYGGSGITITDDADPNTGLDGIGYITRFVPALKQGLLMTDYAVQKAGEASLSASSASTSASSADTARTSAQAAEVGANVAKDYVAAVADQYQVNILEQLKPTLSLDFANNKYEVYEGPVNSLTQMPFNTALDFNRASAATATNATGKTVDVGVGDQRLIGNREGLLIEEARTNLLSYPRQFDNAAWDKSGGYVKPANERSVVDGRAWELETTVTGNFSGRVGQKVSYPAGWNCVSFVVKKGNSDYVAITFEESSSLEGFGGYRAWFNLSTGVVSLVTAAGGATFDKTTYIKSMGGGVYLCSLAIDIPSSALLSSFIWIPDGGNTVTATAGNSVILMAAQGESGSFPTSVIPDGTTFTSRASTATYIDSTGTLQTAAIDVARDDAYGYVDGVLKPIGLLLEEQRTNHWTQNTDLTGADGVGSVTLASSPEFGDFSFRLEATTAGQGIHIQEYGVPYSEGTRKGVYVKAGELSVIGLSVYSIYGGSTTTIRFYLLTQQVDLLSSGSRVINPMIEDFGGGWFRISIEVGSSPWDVYSRFRIYGSDDDGGTANIQSGDGFYLALPQIEEATFSPLSSPIITNGTQVTRAADVSSSPQVTRAADSCVRVLGDEFNDNQGTLYVEFSTKEHQSGIGLTDDTVLERIAIRRSSAGVGQAILSSGGVTNTIDTDAGVYVDEGFNKLAVSWTLAGYKFACNGQIIGSDSLPSGRVPLFTNLIIARSQNIGIRNGVRVNKSCRLFPKALSEAELIALTGGN